jgi:hypothetical protein
MTNFYLDIIKHDPRFSSTERINDLALLEPGTRLAVQALIADAKSQGHDLRVTETYRSQARQEMLFSRHATELRKVGVHGYGLAADFALYIDGKYQTDAAPYSFIQRLAPKHGLVSGIDWGLPAIRHTFQDTDHVQRIPLFRQNTLFSGEWYPPSLYDPHADAVENGVRGL